MERSAFTDDFDDALDKIEGELDLISVDSRLVLIGFPRPNQVKEDRPAHRVRQRPHLLV